MTEVVYNRGKTRILSAESDLNGANLRAIVATAIAAGWDDPDLNTVADLDAVVGVTLLLSDRQTLTTPTVTQDDANDRATAGADSIVFGAQVATSAQALFIYDEGSGTDATRHLLSGHSTGFPQAMDGGLTIQIPNGWLRAT